MTLTQREAADWIHHRKVVKKATESGPPLRVGLGMTEEMIGYLRAAAGVGG